MESNINNNYITLNDKSIENIEILEYFNEKNIVKNYIHALASRPYYSVFQKIKDKFYKLYEQEKSKNVELTEKNFFPHGSELEKKVTGYIFKLKNITIDPNELKMLDDIDTLYRLRQLSDYGKEHNKIEYDKLKEALRMAKDINNFIDKIKIEEQNN